MPPSKRTTSNNKKGDSTGKAAPSKARTAASYRYNEGAKWHHTAYKPPRRISDEEIAAARKMFFELDRDMSGSIDADELAFMLRSMGQNPTDAEVKELIESVDGEGGEESDGKIQLREFIKLYTDGLDSKGKGRKEDVEDVFRAVKASLEGTTNAKASNEPIEGIEKAALAELLSSAYDLEVDVEEMLGSKSADVTKDEMTVFLLGEQAAKS